MKRVLLTGASGRVGRMIRPLLKPHYELVLSDLSVPDDLEKDDVFIEAQLARFPEAERICEGVEGIVHLGGQPVEAPWEVIHESNIVGCYNLFEAARQQGVSRVVFASSNHAIGFYRRDQRIGIAEPVRPDTRYGVSKAFGEALGSLYADKYGLRVMSIRIGKVNPRPNTVRELSIWLHPEDLAQLIRIGLEHPAMHAAIVYGISENTSGWWDNPTADALGYKPAHRSEDHRAHAEAQDTERGKDPVAEAFQGGEFCSQEFKGDLDRI